MSGWYASLSTFYALLALISLAGAAAIAALAAAGRGAALRAALAGIDLPLAWLVALVATAGSLTYSELMGLPPCLLCWVQRGLMYPLVVVVALAARSSRWRTAAFAVSGLGAAVAAFHYVLEWLPADDLAACDPSAPCGQALFRELGFVSLPLMAFAGFTLIAALTAVRASRERPDRRGAPASPERT